MLPVTYDTLCDECAALIMVEDGGLVLFEKDDQGLEVCELVLCAECAQEYMETKESTKKTGA